MILFSLCLVLGALTVSYAFGENIDVPEGYTFENYIPAGGYDFYENDVPADLPEGTIKIGRGIYLYTPEVEPYYDLDNVLVPEIPAFGTIIQPSGLTNIKFERGDKYLWCKSSVACKINFISGTTSVFGEDLYSWPNLGTNSWVIISASGCEMDTSLTYRAQLTGINGIVRRNASISIHPRVNSN